ncbi:MAG TPA: hypothetical protein VFY32_11035 [Solirubrobacteraceae bacterium]|nr:hypothetical protein [Solirubrobacteraceae bacterium]
MRGERRAQAGVVEHVGVQLEDLAAQLIDGLGQRGIGAPVGVLVVAAMMIAQLLAGQQQVLDRVIVQELGQALALALLGGQGLGHQPPALVGVRADPPVARAEDRREQDRPGPCPQQEQRVHDDRVDVRLASGWPDSGARSARRRRWPRPSMPR